MPFDKLSEIQQLLNTSNWKCRINATTFPKFAMGTAKKIHWRQTLWQTP